MPDQVDALRLTEPTPIACLFCTGFEFEMLGPVVRIVAWVELPAPDAEHHERRIIARLVMPTGVARALVRDLRKALGASGH